MQFEIAYFCCPLCKRQLPANSSEHALSTRLCAACQTMVLTAFRGSNSVVAAPAPIVSVRDVPTQVQSNAPSFDHTFVGAPAFFEATSVDAPAFEHESKPPTPFEAPDSVKFDFYQDEDPVDRIHGVQSDSPAFSKNGSSPQREELFEGFVQTISTTDDEYAEVDGSHLIGEPSGITESAVESDHDEASDIEDRSEDRESFAEEEAVTDPWEAPLAAWDYSRSEWPVLVGPTNQRAFRNLRWALATAVVLASAALFYFLIYRPSTPQARIATDTGTRAQVSAVEPRAAAIGSPESVALASAAPAESDQAAAATPLPPETATREAAATNDNSGQGQFSLQAAAFATLDGADEFTEKLKRAGVPSYVVPANLARRGRWFRVRVGRFDSAENAQRFAGEAQQRARAAGIAVQLIVCQYDQP
jgi:cell division septation protein DedD